MDNFSIDKDRRVIETRIQKSEMGIQIGRRYSLDDSSLEILLKDRQTAATKVKELRNYYKNVHKEHIQYIDKHIIMPLWKELNNKLVDPFAKVNIAMSITTHRCQGSNYYNVFVDAHDILKNNRIEEAKRYRVLCPAGRVYSVSGGWRHLPWHSHPHGGSRYGSFRRFLGLRVVLLNQATVDPDELLDR
jgi:hypothetical protein